MPTRTTLDTLMVSISQMVYQGPQGVNLWVYAAVAQGNALKYNANPVQVVVPSGDFSIARAINLNLNLPMVPLGGGQAPLPGSGDGVIVVATDQGIINRIGTFDYPNVYQIVNPTGTGELRPPANLQCIPHLDQGHSAVDFAWDRSPDWLASPGSEFIDIVIANSAAEAQALFDSGQHYGINVSQLPFPPSQNAPHPVVANIPVTPSASHWVRVTEEIRNREAWRWTPNVHFQSVANSGTGGANQAVAAITATFS